MDRKFDNSSGIRKVNPMLTSQFPIPNSSNESTITQEETTQLSNGRTKGDNLSK
ncbi:MAG: hypothetical protein F6J86_05355 [Symploca sp. SIO1B1]|nr:hypothetical protein [Symploca sp. SIO1C2]NER93255.1 hypothetical protein [Symploca sp. SIO1B1]